MVRRAGSGHKAADHRSTLCPPLAWECQFISLLQFPHLSKKRKRREGGREERKVEGSEERKRTEKKLLITPNYMGNYRLSTTTGGAVITKEPPTPSQPLCPPLLKSASVPGSPQTCSRGPGLGACLGGLQSGKQAWLAEPRAPSKNPHGACFVLHFPVGGNAPIFTFLQEKQDQGSQFPIYITDSVC